MSNTVSLFEQDDTTPALGSSHFLPDWWRTTRERCIAPRFVSDLDESPELRDEFIRGAKAMGLVGRRKELQPQQLMLADVLNAGRRFTSVLMPRRSAKTTTILAWLVGRCLSRDDYLCAYAMMTSQKKARDRFMKDVVPILERTYPDESTRPFKLRKANGQERIEFDNGSVIQFLGPKGDEFRSDAYDVIVLDEGGEPDAETAEDVTSAAGPTQDTRLDAMLVVAGTAGKFTDGNLLHDELEKGRDGHPRHGILDFSVPETVTADELAAWEPDDEHPVAHVRELVELVHPGVGGLTTIEAVRDNFDRMKPDQFAREYLGLFTETGKGAKLIDPDKWAAGAHTGELPVLPKRFALVMAVHPDQISASLVAVWRDDEGRAHLGLLDHRRGVQWVAREALKVARKYNVPIVHDTQGAVTVEVEMLQRERPRPKLAPQTFPNVKTAAALLVKEVENGRVVHYDQPEMNNAAALVRKRQVGPTAWALGRAYPQDDIVPIEAAALGLRYFDDERPRPELRPV